MRLLLLSTLTTILIAILIASGLSAQQPAPAAAPQPPKNLKILAPDSNIRETMDSFRTALGVQCVYCHIAGNFASDDNPKKAIARNMLRVARDLNAGFSDGKQHVRCYTCHRGKAIPETDAPAPKAPAAAPPAH